LFVKVFIKRLKWFYDTDEIANFTLVLKMAFGLLLNKSAEEQQGCDCNKVIMIITDGANENAEKVYQQYNWDNGRRVRVFTFLVGREQTEIRQVEWMACANDGRFFHVATIADVNEHVHEYIPVLSRPMALSGHHETTWSNVFVGHLDKELKIAVARPAFITRERLMSRIDLEHQPDEFYKMLVAELKLTTDAPSVVESEYNVNEYQNGDDYYNDFSQDYAAKEEQANPEEYEAGTEGGSDVSITTEEEEEDSTTTTSDQVSSMGDDILAAGMTTSTPKPLPEKKVETDEQIELLLRQTDEALKHQQVLLGVVGVDVPVLRLISKVCLLILL
jgi:hypothetical protein